MPEPDGAMMPGAVPGTPVDGHEACDQVRRAWNVAMSAMDVERVLDLYDEQVLFFGATADLHCGLDGVRSYFQAMPGEACTMDLDGEQVVVLDDQHLALSGFVTFHLRLGGKAHDFPVRMTMVLALRPGGWKIIVQHASAIPQGPP